MGSSLTRRTGDMDRRIWNRPSRGARAFATLVVANSFLLIPIWILNRGLGPQWIALESVILTAVFLLLPSTLWTRFAAWVAGLMVILMSVLQLGDTTARMSLARPLNLYLDVQLVSAIANLLRGTLGTVLGSLVIVGGLLLTVGAIALVGQLLSALHPEPGNRRQRITAAVMLGLALVAIPLRWAHPAGVVMGLPTVQLTWDQARHVTRMMQENERFAAEMAVAQDRYVDVPGLLSGLDGRDVILAFVESYGMSAITDERYAPTILPRLDSMSEAFAEAGLEVVTGQLVAPSQGGMSWLGHGSVLSGLWLENQLRYDLLLASARHTLIDDFEAAGYQTAALMPAITMAWPEGERFGYERIYAWQDIAYAGPPLNWVTMPDQFTWSYLENTIRQETDRPLFAELGLISSHAPWTPILPVFDNWDSIGDGEVFAPFAEAGETPEELWRNGDRVREHYALAVGYAIDAMASYAARYVDERTVLIALGDHQPAPLITGDDASRTVPVHVIASDPAVLAPFLRWGFAPGVLPPTDGDVARMDAFRDWFVNAYSTTPMGGQP